jgi:hypothetical protein
MALKVQLVSHDPYAELATRVALALRDQPAPSMRVCLFFPEHARQDVTLAVARVLERQNADAYRRLVMQSFDRDQVHAQRGVSADMSVVLGAQHLTISQYQEMVMLPLMGVRATAVLLQHDGTANIPDGFVTRERHACESWPPARNSIPQ